MASDLSNVPGSNFQISWQRWTPSEKCPEPISHSVKNGGSVAHCKWTLRVRCSHSIQETMRIGEGRSGLLGCESQTTALEEGRLTGDKCSQRVPFLVKENQNSRCLSWSCMICWLPKEYWHRYPRTGWVGKTSMMKGFIISAGTQGEMCHKSVKRLLLETLTVNDGVSTTEVRRSWAYALELAPKLLGPARLLWCARPGLKLRQHAVPCPTHGWYLFLSRTRALYGGELALPTLPSLWVLGLCDTCQGRFIVIHYK